METMLAANDFTPFYDRWVGTGPASGILKVLVSLVLGLVVLGMQYLTIGTQVRDNSAWSLGLIAFCAALSQYYATHTFRRMLTDVTPKLNQKRTTELIEQARQSLSDKRFLSYGAFFGVLNSGMGMLFGVPYDGWSSVLSSYAEFFIVGFICGIPICGIRGVLRTVEAIAGDKTLKLDYTSPDGCGGTHVIGDALVKFASVTLVTGVLIAWYILHTHWTRASSESWRSHPVVNSLLLFWGAFPFIMSLLVLFLPAMSVHRRLGGLKVEQDALLEGKISEIQDQISQMSAVDKESLLKVHDYYVARRSLLYKMSTWPFDLVAQLKYATVFILDAVVHIANVAEHWRSIAPHLRSGVHGILS